MIIMVSIACFSCLYILFRPEKYMWWKITKWKQCTVHGHTHSWWIMRKKLIKSNFYPKKYCLFIGIRVTTTRHIIYLYFYRVAKWCRNLQQLHCPVKINKIDYDCWCLIHNRLQKVRFLKKIVYESSINQLFYSICISLPASLHKKWMKRMWYTLKIFCCCYLVANYTTWWNMWCTAVIFDKNSQFLVLFCKFIAFFVH